MVFQKEVILKTSGSLSTLLRKNIFPKIANEKDYHRQLDHLQLEMLRIQQGIWHQKKRAIIVLEGFDAAGKGGVIRHITEKLDPRGFKVHPIGPPSSEEQSKHWLFRFWEKIPEAGTIAIFDRSWYGRVLVERVDGLAKPAEWRRAYGEIREFEKTLADDGVIIIKFFLAISKQEQLKRFEERLQNPYKQWKLTVADLDARKQWSEYVSAVDDLFKKPPMKLAPWYLVAADHKHYARLEVMGILVKKLQKYGSWMKRRAAKYRRRTLQQVLKELGVDKLI
jgi:polyphosphate kinase 2 (PPK2 family)